jgi:hypothetical protein
MVLFTITVIHYPFKKLNEIAKIKSKEQRRLWPRLRPLNRSLYGILCSSMDAGSREKIKRFNRIGSLFGASTGFQMLKIYG